MTRALAALVLLASTSGCGVAVLSPRPTPERVIPDVPSPVESPAPGHGRVLIDVVDGPAEVDVPGTTTSAGEAAPRSDGQPPLPSALAGRQLCRSPCAVDLPTGRHTLRLSLTEEPGRQAVVDLDVAEGTMAYRRSMDVWRSNAWSRWVGISMMTVGALLGLATAGVAGLHDETFEQDWGVPFVVGSSITAFVVSLTGLFVWALVPPTMQPGSEVSWSLEPAAATRPGGES